MIARMPINFEEIKRRRLARKLTMEEAGKLAGFKQPAQRWNDLETGRYADPQVSRLQAAAKALGCKVDDLLE